MGKLITTTKIHGNNLRKYGLKIGDKVETSMGIATVTGICEMESHINSFQFDKGYIYTSIMTKLEDGTEVNFYPNKVKKYIKPANFGTSRSLDSFF